MGQCGSAFQKDALQVISNVENNVLSVGESARRVTEEKVKMMNIVDDRYMDLYLFGSSVLPLRMSHAI